MNGKNAKSPALRNIVLCLLAFVAAILLTGCGPDLNIKAGTTVIKAGAYYNRKGIRTVTIPNTVTEIQAQAFMHCGNLQSVAMPDSVTEIGQSAFKDCASLTDIAIPNGITILRSHVFENCESLTRIVIPDSVTCIEESAFANCAGLTSVTLGSGIESIAGNAFQNCESLTDLAFSDGTTEIGKWVNRFSNLKSVSIGSGVRDIEQGAFSGCKSLTGITLSPDNPYFVSIGSIVVDKEMTSLAYYPENLIEKNKALFFGDADGHSETLDAASVLNSPGVRVIPLRSDGEVDMAMFAHLPERMRTLTPDDAEYALIRSEGMDARDDYVVKGTLNKAYGVFDSVARVWLRSKEGATATLCTIRHEPPESGSVKQYGSFALANLYGKAVTMREIWGEIGPLFEDIPTP